MCSANLLYQYQTRSSKNSLHSGAIIADKNKNLNIILNDKISFRKNENSINI